MWPGKRLILYLETESRVQNFKRTLKNQFRNKHIQSLTWWDWATAKRWWPSRSFRCRDLPREPMLPPGRWNGRCWSHRWPPADLRPRPKTSLGNLPCRRPFSDEIWGRFASVLCATHLRSLWSAQKPGFVSVERPAKCRRRSTDASKPSGEETLRRIDLKNRKGQILILLNKVRIHVSLALSNYYFTPKICWCLTLLAYIQPFLNDEI